MHQSPGHRQFLLHSVAPFVHALAPPIPQSHLQEQFLASRLSLGGAHFPDPAVEFQVVLGAHLLIETRVFQQRAGAISDFVGVGSSIEAQDLSLTGGWFEQTQQQMDGGGFAGAVGAQESEDDSGGHFQR